MDSATTVIDAPQVLVHPTSGAERLSQQANSLGASPEHPSAPSTAGAFLPDTQIVGAETAKDSKPSWLSRQLTGIGAVAGAIGSGVAGNIETGYGVAKEGGLAVGNAADSVYE